MKRNFFSGPGFNYTNMALFKDFPLGRADSPRFIQVRLESFNVFNHANFSPPDGNLTDGSSFGQITSVVTPVPDGGAGDPQPGRAVQLAGKIYILSSLTGTLKSVLQRVPGTVDSSSTHLS